MKQLKDANEEQKRLIDQLETQKTDMKLDFDNQLYAIEKRYQQEHTKSAEQTLKRL